MILNWADAYSFRAEVKRSMIEIRPKHVICTSNFSIRETCHYNGIHVEATILALERRFK